MYSVSLLHAANGRGWMARYPVEEECREPLLEEDRCSGEQVADGLPLLLPGVSGQCRAQLPQLLQSDLVPATGGLSDL